MHVLGRYGGEATLFRLAGQLERARPWAHRRPPLVDAVAARDAPVEIRDAASRVPRPAHPVHLQPVGRQAAEAQPG